MKTKIDEILRQYELAKQLSPFTIQPWLDGKPSTYDAESLFVQEFILSEPLARTGSEWLLPYAVAAGFGHGWASQAVGELLEKNLHRKVFAVEVLKAACEGGRLDSIGTIPSLSGVTGTGRTSWGFDRDGAFSVLVNRPGDRVVARIDHHHGRWSAQITGDLGERHVLAALKALYSIQRYVGYGYEFEEAGLSLVRQAHEVGLSVGAIIDGAEPGAEIGATEVKELGEECGEARPNKDEYTLFSQSVSGESILSDQNVIFLKELSSSSEIIRFRRADGGTEFYSG